MHRPDHYAFSISHISCPWKYDDQPDYEATSLEVYFGKSEYWLAFANCMLANTNHPVNKFLH